MAGTARSNKDKEMAAYMKAKGITRTTMNCPMCHSLIGIGSLYLHLGQCRGTHRSYGRMKRAA